MSRTMPTLAIVIIATAVTLGAWPQEAHAGLCVKRNGVLSFRSGACKKREKPIAPDAIGAGGPKGDPGPRGDPGPDAGLDLLTTAGEFIGGFDLENEIILKNAVNGLFVSVSGFFETGFIDQSVILYHESLDCGGPAFLREAANPVIRVGRIRDGWVYYAGDPVTTHTAILSTQQPQPSCAAPDTITSLGLCCHNANPGTRTLGPLKLLDPTPVFGAPPWGLRP